MPRARLFSPIGATRGLSAEIEDEATVGRVEGHSLVIDDGLISKAHARIIYDAVRGGFLLEDLGSTNGTALDGAPVVGRERLGHLHVITFSGRHEFVFQDLDRSRVRHGTPAAPAVSGPIATSATPKAASTTCESTTEVVNLGPSQPDHLSVPEALAERLRTEAPTDMESLAVERTQIHEVAMSIPGNLADPDAALADQVAPAAEEPEAASLADATAEGVPLAGLASPFILEVDHPDAGSQRFPLRYGDNRVGRVKRADIQLKDERISRDHAVIIVGTTIAIRDRGSNNHTYLEDERIAGEVQVEPGDRLRFGPLEARIIRQASQPGSAAGGSDESR